MSNGDDWGDDGYMGQLPIGTTQFKVSGSAVLTVVEKENGVDWYSSGLKLFGDNDIPNGDYVIDFKKDVENIPATYEKKWHSERPAPVSTNTEPPTGCYEFSGSNQRFFFQVDATGELSLTWWKKSATQPSGVFPGNTNATFNVNAVQITSPPNSNGWYTWIDELILQ